MDLTGATLFENWRFTCRIGAILFCIGVILNNNVKMLLSRKVLLQSAKICFPAFMIHNVVIGTLTSYLYLKLDYVSTYVQFYIFAISFLTVIVLSIIYVRFIEPYINCLITRFMQLI